MLKHCIVIKDHHIKLVISTHTFISLVIIEFFFHFFIDLLAIYSYQVKKRNKCFIHLMLKIIF